MLQDRNKTLSFLNIDLLIQKLGKQFFIVGSRKFTTEMFLKMQEAFGGTNAPRYSPVPTKKYP